MVADASAILAALKNEPFNNVDPRRLVGATISAVNFCEVLSKLHDDGLNDAQAHAAVSRMDLRVIPFDGSQARTAAQLRCTTRHAGLSLGDRACLALGDRLRRPVVTADRIWANLGVGVEILVIR
ncbi:MAG: type II toxin-antitoxin system VapC family toxin [Alphaproteobacteria bacterium]|nr:type II toxin-antitoxin system VapC family toxin [Alphaproteobacteria bacterium]